MKKEYYAHSIEGKPPEEWQPLEEHLRKVATRAGEWANEFQSADWAWNAGWLHDLGKAADEFQAYLLRANGLDDEEYDGIGRGRVNHSSAGAAFAEERLGPMIGRTLAYLAAGHHAGLPDWFESDGGYAALRIRLQEGKENLNRVRSVAEEFARQLRQVFRPPTYVKAGHFHLWVRMLFSCLVDSDFLDTEAFMNPEQAKDRKGFSGLAELKTLFDQHMQVMAETAQKTKVNAVRQQILAACRAAAHHEPGIFSLSVPTGGGKTLSAMSFALDHAVKHGKEL